MAVGMLERVRRFFALEESDSYSISNSSVEGMQPHGNVPVRSQQQQRANVVSLQGRRPNSSSQQIVLLEPSSFGEAREVAEALKQKKPIIVNVRKTDKELARRIVDFLSGIAYAIDGHMTKIADSIYIFAPATVDIISQGDQPDYQKEHDSLFNSGG